MPSRGSSSSYDEGVFNLEVTLWLTANSSIEMHLQTESSVRISLLRYSRTARQSAGESNDANKICRRGTHVDWYRPNPKLHRKVERARRAVSF